MPAPLAFVALLVLACNPGTKRRYYSIAEAADYVRGATVAQRNELFFSRAGVDAFHRQALDTPLSSAKWRRLKRAIYDMADGHSQGGKLLSVAAGGDAGAKFYAYTLVIAGLGFTHDDAVRVFANSREVVRWDVNRVRIEYRDRLEGELEGDGVRQHCRLIA